jgi:hypothetical protein
MVQDIVQRASIWKAIQQLLDPFHRRHSGPHPSCIPTTSKICCATYHPTREREVQVLRRPSPHPVGASPNLPTLSADLASPSAHGPSPAALVARCLYRPTSPIATRAPLDAPSVSLDFQLASEFTHAAFRSYCLAPFRTLSPATRCYWTRLRPPTEKLLEAHTAACLARPTLCGSAPIGRLFRRTYGPV